MADDAIRVPCSGCGKKVVVRPDQVGRRLRCPGCGAAFRVQPNPTDATEPPPDPDADDLPAAEAGELVLAGRPKRQPGTSVTAKFPQSPDVVYDATVFAVRRAGGDVRGVDRVNRLVRFATDQGGAQHVAAVFPGTGGGSELEVKADGPSDLQDASLYAHIADELMAYLTDHATRTNVPAVPRHKVRRRSRRDEDDDHGFRCPYCRCRAMPITRNKISTGGWVVFAVMLLVCFPLCFLGLLMNEPYRECYECGMKIGS